MTDEIQKLRDEYIEKDIINMAADMGIGYVIEILVDKINEQNERIELLERKFDSLNMY